MDDKARNILEPVLESSTSITPPEKLFDKLYITVLSRTIRTDYTSEKREEVCSALKHILGSVVVLCSQLSAYALAKLLHITKQEVDQTLQDLDDILDIPEDQTRLLRLYHPSFRKFLLSKDRCIDSKFWVDEKQAHRILAENCISLMSATLKQDICGLGTQDVLATDLKSSQLEQCLPSEVQYACLYWVQHLQKSNIQLYDNDQVHRFLQTHLLHWLEALSWMQNILEGVRAILSLESITLTSDCPRLHYFIYDIKRFALYYRSTIKRVPIQIYSIALVSAPANSIVRNQFEDKIPKYIQKRPDVQKNWSPLLYTLEGHSDSVNAVAFSRDGKQLASAADDQTVKLWDAATGAALQTLKGHSGTVPAVAFSPDGKQLASGSADRTVRLWDTATGAVLQTLKGHSDWVLTVAFSLDGKQLASGSRDKTVRIWDVATGAALQTLKGHSDWVLTVAFSPDGKQLASGSLDKTVRLWDVATGAALQTLEGYSDWVNAVAFSPDGKQLASASYDQTVKLWDVAIGAVL
ncbi:WD40 repeat-like protein [Hyaloscypha variabilis F]|nr:WD40 repeat-like protein [Hyaloscypha variabilis F]